MGGLRQLKLIGGLILVLMGLLWAGQGSGTFPYPVTSPMINESQWILYGVLLALVGLALIWWSRRS